MMSTIERLVEAKMLFPVIWTLVYLPVCLIGYAFRGLYKKGWGRMKKEITKNILFCAYFVLGYMIIRLLYPALPDYWKLVGTGFAFLFMAVPMIFLLMGISDSIYEYRKEDLFNAGWRETVQGDYKDWEEYFREHSYEYFHPEHGIHSVTKAEKIQRRFA